MANKSTSDAQFTNDEATATKAYAVRLGYWKDPYIKSFCPVPSPSTPEISRGYYVRVQSFEAVAARFIEDCKGECQLVNLGAGSDTLYFRLNDRNLLPTSYVELDLPYNVKMKVSALRGGRTLQMALRSGDSFTPLPLDKDSPKDRFSFGCYRLYAYDLESPSDTLADFLCNSPDGPNLDPELPTLFLAECVLVYISSKVSDTLLSKLSSTFSKSAFLNYEQVNMQDKFGAIMRSHFRDRSCDLPGLGACDSLESQKNRSVEFLLPVFHSTDLPLLLTSHCYSNVIFPNLNRSFGSSKFIYDTNVSDFSMWTKVMLKALTFLGHVVRDRGSYWVISSPKVLFIEAGWSHVQAWTINEVFSALPQDAVKRISRIEMLDDTEITQQLYDHYCIVLAANTGTICNWPSLQFILSDLK